MSNIFETVSKYPDARIPERKTAASAGYDFYVAEDTLVPPYESLMSDIVSAVVDGKKDFDELEEPRTLDELAALTKKLDAKPTLVPTGIKANLANDTYLQLSVRSSCPLKYWLVLANGVGIIDADYYNNPDNEGHIFFQIINLSPVPIILKKGDAIGQGIIQKYETDNDSVTATREGGFGSTDASNN